MKGIFVIKRDGTKEEFDPEKIHKILYWATEGLTGVSVSHLEMKAQLQLYPGITTDTIHEILIAAAHELISEESPNYQWVAARLRLFQIRKEALGQYDTIPVYDLVQRNIKLGYYTKELLDWYTKEEWDHFDNVIDHSRDFNHAYAGMEQFRGKYLVQDRVTKKVFETPQYLNLLVAATMFHKYTGKERVAIVKECYDLLSTGVISLPTPIMAGLRTSVKQFSSCVLIETDDSLDSINATTSSIVKYISQKAGIGIHGGHIRALGAKIRNGDTKHTGVTPFYRMFQAAVKSCSQGGVRGGAATLSAPYWHLEIETILNLKNNKGTEENSVRHMDYCILFNRFAYSRLLENGNITLFSPNEVPDLQKAFYDDQKEFERLYVKYENTKGIIKHTISAEELFDKFITERKETGRIYLMNIDHANDHGAFIPEFAPIKMTNLCTEITLATKPLKHVYDEEGEIALCTLAAINLGLVKKKEDLQRPAEILVRGLNELLDYQNYPIPAAKNSTLKYRPLGIGVINLAYWLAKNNFKYTDNSGLEAWDELMEAFQYYLIKASSDIAKEKNATIPGWDNIKYSRNIFPIDTYKTSVDQLVKNVQRMPWGELREQVAQYGMYNSNLSSFMPSETSAQISNATNGIEPPRAFISVKGSGEGRLKQVVPGFPKLKNRYELLWDMKSCTGYLNLVAVAQKYLDQAISTNTFYNPEHYENDEIPKSVMIKDLLYAYKMGLKTLYYHNTYDGQTDDVEADISSAIADEEDCDSCKI